jgi:hypothetical protein
MASCSDKVAATSDKIGYIYRQVGTVAGLIFMDANGNGLQDPGEDAE